AIQLLDHCFDDIMAAERHSALRPDGLLAKSLTVTRLPQPFGDTLLQQQPYLRSKAFFRTLVAVCWKLAQRESMPLTSRSEQVAASRWRRGCSVRPPSAFLHWPANWTTRCPWRHHQRHSCLHGTSRQTTTPPSRTRPQAIDPTLLTQRLPGQPVAHQPMTRAGVRGSRTPTPAAPDAL